MTAEVGSGAAGPLVVVGAGPGIGAAIARRFAVAGHAVGLVARDAGRLDDVAAGVRAAGRGVVAAATADATDPDALRAALDALAAELGEPAALCFSPLPDVGLIRPVLDTEAEELLGSLRLGVGGPAAAVRRVLPAMLARGAGSLLFTTGSGALRPDPARAASAVTTAATTTYVGLLRSALDGSGVRVGHTVVVGPVAHGRADAHEPDDVVADLWRHHTGEAAASPTVLRLPDA